MGFFRRRAVAPRLETERLVLRPPDFSDHLSWAGLRRESATFLRAWEPAWAPDHLTARAFRDRVVWSARAIAERRAYPFFLERAEDGALLGALTLDNLRRGPAQAATVGYWIGAPHARQGYMAEALAAARDFGFGDLGLSRLEAACLPDNEASIRLLRRCGFRDEGLARAYLQIAGVWRDHTLFAALSPTRAAGAPAATTR